MWGVGRLNKRFGYTFGGEFNFTLRHYMLLFNHNVSRMHVFMIRVWGDWVDV